MKSSYSILCFLGRILLKTTWYLCSSEQMEDPPGPKRTGPYSITILILILEYAELGGFLKALRRLLYLW